MAVATWSMCSSLFTPAPFAARRSSRVAMKGGESEDGMVNLDAKVYSAGLKKLERPKTPAREYRYNNKYEKIYVDSPQLNPGVTRWDIDYYLYPYTSKEGDAANAPEKGQAGRAAPK